MAQTNNRQNAPNLKQGPTPPAPEAQQLAGLPPPVQLAQIAAGFGMDTPPRNAIASAILLYLWAVKITQKHANDSPEQLTSQFGDPELSLSDWVERTKEAFRPIFRPLQPSRFPVTFGQMLRYLMPRVEKDGDRQKLFRDFLATEFVAETNAETARIKGGELLGNFKQRAFGESEFDTYSFKFRQWRTESISAARRNAGEKGRKTEKKLARLRTRKK
jgi:hypothetical protein